MYAGLASTHLWGRRTPTVRSSPRSHPVLPLLVPAVRNGRSAPQFESTVGLCIAFGNPSLCAGPGSTGHFRVSCRFRKPEPSQNAVLVMSAMTTVTPGLRAG